MKIDNKTLVSDIVTKNYKTASVFKAHEIDFCCNGNRSIENVCDLNANKIDALINELEDCFKVEERANDYSSWDIDLLSDYIYHNHHRYIETRVPEIKQYLEKIVRVHGHNHPELAKINELFIESANDLTVHMKKEELILFPYFKKLAIASREKTSVSSSTLFNTVESPIATMHEEHDNEGERFREISRLSNNYTPPTDACNTYKVTYSMLKEFEEDLHKHIHLENNILFKKGIELEKTLTK